jgi:hypothetical protein
MRCTEEIKEMAEGKKRREPKKEIIQKTVIEVSSRAGLSSRLCTTNKTEEDHYGQLPPNSLITQPIYYNTCIR